MATVKSYSKHVEDLTGGGTLAPGETRNIDVSGAREIDLIARNLLVVLDASDAPAVPQTKAGSIRVVVPYARTTPFTVDLSSVADPAADGRLVGVDGLPHSAATGADISAAVAAVNGRFRGAYSALAANTPVKANDIVTQAGALYARNADGLISGAFNGANWTLVSSGSSVPVTVTRDGSGTVTAVSSPGSAITSITRSGGRVTSYVENGVTRTVSRDGNGRVTGVS